MSNLTADLIGFGLIALNLGCGIPLALGRIGPNVYVGFRTKSTLENRDLWFRINRPLGKAMIFGGVLGLVSMLASASIAPVFRLQISLAATLLPVIISTVVLAQKHLK